MAEPILDLFTLFGPIPPLGAEPGAGTLRTAMEKHGVAGAVTLSTRAIYHTAAAGNRETQAICAEVGGALQPAGLLDPRVAKADTLLTGARIIMLFPATQKWPVAYAPLEHALSSLAARGVKVPLFVEASRPGDATALRDVLQKTGYAGPTILASTTGASLSEAIAIAATDERYSLCTDGLRGIGEVAMVVGLLGASRVVFGSGATARISLASALSFVRSAGLNEADRAQVINGNTKRLLLGGVVA